MGNLQQLLTDLFNGFTPSDLPLFFIQLFTPFVLTWILIRISGYDGIGGSFLMYPLLVALVVILSKQSVPLAVSSVGLCLLLLPPIKTYYENKEGAHVVVFSLVLGWGCGSGFLIPVILVFVFILLPASLVLRKK